MKEVLHDIAAFPPYAAGWAVGVVARFCAWVRDAVIAGYRDGRGI